MSSKIEGGHVGLFLTLTAKKVNMATKNPHEKTYIDVVAEKCSKNHSVANDRQKAVTDLSKFSRCFFLL